MKMSNDILLPEFERLIQKGHIVEFTPQGISMRPFIEGGADSVLLRQPKILKVGYIVLARVNEQYVLHRIYKIDDEQIILQGDGNLKGQEICHYDDIIARVVCIKRKGGKRKRLTKGRMWRYTPTCIKWIVLKVYNKIVNLQKQWAYED